VDHGHLFYKEVTSNCYAATLYCTGFGDGTLRLYAMSSDPRLKFDDTSMTRVLYQDGQEFTAADKKGEIYALGNASLGLAGNFGDILAPLPALASSGGMVWHHWEKGLSGRLAVFSYKRSEPRTWFEQPSMYGYDEFAAPEKRAAVIAYIYGQIVIDPTDGSVLRLTEIARTPSGSVSYFGHGIGWPQPEDNVINEIRNVVEFAPVNVGPETYLCPSRRLVTSIWPLFGMTSTLDDADYMPASMSESPRDGEEAFADVTFSHYQLWEPAPGYRQ